MAEVNATSRPKPTGAWAVAQLCLAIAAIAWAVLLFLYPGPEGTPTEAFPREPFWPGATLAGGAFFFVAFVLFAKNHPDARVVGLFGLAIFGIANILLAVDRFDTTATCTDVNGNDFACTFEGRVYAIAAVTGIIAILQLTLLVTVTLYEARVRRRAAEDARDKVESEWT